MCIRDSRTSLHDGDLRGGQVLPRVQPQDLRVRGGQLRQDRRERPVELADLDGGLDPFFPPPGQPRREAGAAARPPARVGEVVGGCAVEPRQRWVGDPLAGLPGGDVDVRDQVVDVVGRKSPGGIAAQGLSLIYI